MQNKYCLYYTKLQKIFKPLRVFCCVANGCCPVSNKTQFHKFCHTSQNVRADVFCFTYTHVFICTHTNTKCVSPATSILLKMQDCRFAHCGSFFGRGPATPLRASCSTCKRNVLPQLKTFGNYKKQIILQIALWPPFVLVRLVSCRN